MNSTRLLLRRPAMVGRPLRPVAFRCRTLWSRSGGAENNKPPPPPPLRRHKGLEAELAEEELGSMPPPNPRTSRRWLALLGVFSVSALATSYYLLTTAPEAPVEPLPAQKRKTKSPKTPAANDQDVAAAVIQDPEQARHAIRSQQDQVTRSWEDPGVWMWGDNTGRVADPHCIAGGLDIKAPRRLAFFDGQVLRDLKLTRNFGVAVTDRGDIVQWGTGFSASDPRPTPTLVGKDIVKAEVSADRVVALSSDGSVYTMPASLADQQRGNASSSSSSSSWLWGLWSSSKPASASNVAYRIATPTGLIGRERVVDISSGREHCLMVTSSGRLFAAASSTLSFPCRGQLGIPGLSWAQRPMHLPYDAAHEVPGLKGLQVVAVATGDEHSVALDSEGRVWAWGDNTFGQLGYENEMAYAVAPAPRRVDIERLYHGTGLTPTVTGVAAGGCSTFFTTESVVETGDGQKQRQHQQSVSELWACGRGVNGQLGTGKWTHASGTPTRVMALSALTEYDEGTRSLVPIRLSGLSVGTTHASAVLANATKTSAPADDVKWGADVMIWGGNEHFQLGTGRRANSNRPLYIAPLVDGVRGSVSHHPEDKDLRLQLAPRRSVKVGGRWVSTEQRILCGEHVTAVYTGV